MHKKKKFPCSKCSKKFTTNRGLASHSRMHKTILPDPKPVQETKEFSKEIPYSGNYLNARGTLDIGDVFYRVEKHVVKAITVREGSRDAYIESVITKSNWQQNKPE